MGFVSAVALAFEVALTRICAVLLQYHLSFAVVSMAVLGIGLGGVAAWMAVRRGAETRIAVAALVVLGPAIVLALAVLLRLPFATHWPWLLPLILPPFAAAGVFQALALRAFAARAGRVYAADLFGGAAGAWIAVVALDALGGPVQTALVLAVAAAGGAWWWTGGRGTVGRWAPAALATTLAATVLHTATGALDVDWTRAPHKLLATMLRPTAQGTPRLVPHLYRWDAYSRVDVLELDSPRGVQRSVFIDGETPTPMLPVEIVAPNAAGVALGEALAALPLRLASPQAVLSIGSGGGHDVVLARRFGATHVDAVELNAGVLRVVDAARDFTGDVYRQPGVRVHHAEGRLFARRAAPGSYDLVFLALAQSLAGNLQEYALSENYLYTREALADYLRVLRPGGQLAFLVSNPAVQTKLLRTALEVLRARGAPATDCVVALASPGEVPYDHLVLVRAEPFGPHERDALAREIGARRYLALHVPAGVRASPAMAPSVPAARPAPATDAAPFFFHLEAGTPAGLRLLLTGAGIALALAFVGSWRAGRGVPHGAGTGVYFALLGLAFLMVEVLVLQRTILFLGFPALNLAVVLATFLVAAGCGSAASERLRDRRALQFALGALALALVALQPLLGLLHAPLDRLPLAARSVAVAGVLFPFGFAMGLPFPAGVRLLPEPARALVPWFWALNGIGSIVGSALVVAVVLDNGFRIAGLLPAALYAAAGLAARALPRA
jgi:SAM-dependent methyltransferase